MEKITLRGHFDGRHILLDEPFELEPNTQLIITILPESWDEEYQDWVTLSLENLGRVYSGDEPDYPLELVKEAIPDYEGR